MLNASPSRAWAGLAYGYGLLVAAGLGYFLLGLPIQVADGFTNMVSMPGRPLVDAVYNEFFQASYVRPLLLWHQLVIFKLADGRYYEWFRGWHVLQVLLLVVLFVRLLRPRTAADAAVVPLALAVLIGIHTFAGTVREAFPINTFMTILLCCVGAANLAMGPALSTVEGPASSAVEDRARRPVGGPVRWWRDLLAIAIFVFAALTVESGLLVWAVFAAAYLAGARGVSRWGLVALTLLFGGYFYLRFAVLEVAGPGLIERSSGYGFGVRDPDELIELFGTNPIGFYAYNIVTSIASVLFSEPRAGVFRIVRAMTEDEMQPYMVVNVVASTLATAVLLRFLWKRRQAWLARRFEPGDQLVFISLVMLVANAVVSYPYTKDVIMSPAGVFYGLAVAVAARDLLIDGLDLLPVGAAFRRPVAGDRAEASASTDSARHRRVLGRSGVMRTAAAVVVLTILSGAWAVRAAGIHVALRKSAISFRNEWAYVDQWMARERKAPPAPQTLRLQNQLQDDAITLHPGTPMLSGDWLEWLDIE